METLEIQFVKIGINGEGIGYHDRKPVFCAGVLPNETALIRITETQERFERAELVKITSVSSVRVTPECRYQKECSGCAFMHVSHAAQLSFKKQLLTEAMRKYAHVNPSLIRDIKTDHNNFHYRNSCKMPVQRIKGRMVSGMYRSGSNQFVPIDTCMIHQTKLEEVRRQALDIISTSSMTAFDIKHSDGLRYLYVRGLNDQYQIALITGRTKPDAELVQRLAAIEGVKTVAYSVNGNRRSRDIFGRTAEVLAGDGHIIASVNGIQLQLSCQSFFQMNDAMAASLYKMAIDKIDPCNTMVEAYCGVGAMSIMAAAKAKKIIGIESVPEAIVNAKANAVLNHVEDHVDFICADAAEGLSKILKEENVDTLLADPPRSGMDPQMISLILNSSISRIVYISCNPSTAARNINELQSTFTVRTIIPFDLFPETPHVESLIVLTRNASKKKGDSHAISE